MGYAAGALLCGVLADYAGISFSFISVGIITVIAGLVLPEIETQLLDLYAVAFKSG